MENIHDNQEENYELGYQASPSSVDQNEQQSPTEVTVYSTVSGDSFAYCRTNSETSAFSEHTDDNISCSDTIPSPLCWPAVKSPNQAVLSRLGMRHHKHVIDDKSDDQEAVDIGNLTSLSTYIRVFV